MSFCPYIRVLYVCVLRQQNYSTLEGIPLPENKVILEYTHQNLAKDKQRVHGQNGEEK